MVLDLQTKEVKLNRMQAERLGMALKYAMKFQATVGTDLARRVSNYLSSGDEPLTPDGVRAPYRAPDVERLMNLVPQTRHARETLGRSMSAWLASGGSKDDKDAIIGNQVMTILEVGEDGVPLEPEEVLEADSPLPLPVEEGGAFAVKLSVEPATIMSLFVSALEGGSNYWLRDMKYKGTVKPEEEGVVWWGSANVYAAPNFSAQAVFDDPKKEEGNGKGRKTIFRDDLEHGLTVMAQKYPSHFGDMLAENDDANTADVFMQCVLFGDVIYG